jgi:hypothetical protein
MELLKTIRLLLRVMTNQLREWYGLLQYLGLHLLTCALSPPLQTAEAFLNPEPSQEALGYEPGDLENAFRQTVEACKP